MPRLHTAPVAEATGQAAELFVGIKAAFGTVPQVYVDMGSNSSIALAASISLDGAVSKGSLSQKDVEIVKLVVSEVAQCDYCLAAHTMLGKRHGLKAEDMLNLRHGATSGDLRADALANFARLLVTMRGTVPANSVAAVKAAGFSDAQIVDIALAITSITMTNLFNRINDTVVDFPPAG